MKDEYRKRARDVRRDIFESLSEQDLYDFERKRIDAFFSNSMIAKALLQPKVCVGIYFSMGSEASTHQMITELQGRGFDIAVPIVDSGSEIGEIPGSKAGLESGFKITDTASPIAQNGMQHTVCQNPSGGSSSDQVMRFVSFHPESELELSEHRFYQPKDSHLLASVYPDLLIVPILAFDHDKNRLGYGKGHYDRYFDQEMLSRSHSSFRVGWAYSRQRVSKLPVLETDVAMDLIITENRVW